MKTFILLLFAFSVQLNASVLSQQKVSLKMRNVSAKELIKEIENQTNLGFIYNLSEIEKLDGISIEVEEQTVKEVLDEVLNNTGLTYELNKSVIIIMPKSAKAIKEIQQDKKEIKGKVTDKDAIPLPGVSVVIKGTNVGVATNIDGEYILEIEKDNSILVFSFVGMNSREVKYSGQVSLDIVLLSNTEQMKEVVVTGIQTIEKGRATGSFTILKSEDMDNVVTTNFREKLIGTVPGVYVDGDNGLLIRGTGSLRVNSNPLIVIDGIPSESINVNPNDIEQITVLKDAASASIWGIRAANGVIVITTKRGTKNGRLTVNYTGDYSIEDKVNIGDFNKLNALEYAELEFERDLAKGLSTSDVGGYNPVEKVWFDLYNGDINEDQAWERVRQIGSFDNEKQIEDLFFQKSTVQHHNISLKGGTDKISHYFSADYIRSKSALIGNSSDYFNFVGNTDINIAKGIDLQIGLKGTYGQQDLNGDSDQMSSYSVYYDLPYQRILDEEGNYVDQNYGYSDEYRALLTENGFLDWSKNNLRQMRMNDKKGENLRLTTSLKLDIELFKGLVFSTFGSYSSGKVEEKDHYSKDHYLVRNLKNRFTQVENTDDPKIVAYHLPRKGGILDLSYYKSNFYTVRNILRYESKFNDFSVRLMAGNELYSKKTESSDHRLFGYQEKTLSSEAIDLVALRSGKLIGASGNRVTLYEEESPLSISESVEKYASYFGSMGLTFKEKYDLFMSVRLDQTNLLVNSSKYRNNPSWSVGGKWNISDEEFFDSDWINSLAFRASYGLSGNIDKNTGPDIVGSISSAGYATGLTSLYITNPENKELGWEKSNVLNLGLDYSVLDNSLSGSIEIYEKKSHDLLSSVNIDPSSGWSSVLKNTAEVLNRGVDVSLNARILNKQLKWDVGTVFSYNYNKVTDLNYTPSVSSIYFGSPIRGKAISYIAAIPYGGLDASGEPLIMKKGDNTKYDYSELDNLTIEDHKFMGRSTPPVFGSLTNTFRYKDFSLGVFVTYKLGHKVRLPAADNSSWSFFQPTKWLSKKYRWVKSGDEKTKMIPKFSKYSYDRIKSVKYSDYLVDDGDIIRLKSISLEYNLSRLFKNTAIKRASVRLNAENLWYWAANRYDIDSDYMSGLPIRAKYTVRLKLNL